MGDRHFTILPARTLRELRESITYVLLLAPDAFGPTDRLDFDSGFEEIELGIERCADLFEEREDASRFRNLAKRAKQAYLQGDDKLGAMLLQQMWNELT